MEILFALYLKSWRRSKKILQKQAAEFLQVKLGTLRSWEEGKRTPSKLALAEIKRRMDGILDDESPVPYSGFCSDSKTNPSIR